ncbi:hypothetical protein O181_097320 [Austropuccinia psidii MF-1]|uniref:Uncharacterized protein n=1 Tax=Austropuccinia psidii MF-1 TaxID=1389203 RepID=A0A9Q3J9D4_9BASI|nr:hypothetical protein [Austropuccinia psidii MF-1]
MSSKLTELTEFSPFEPPSVLCGFCILSRLASPWSMVSSGHFDPGQTYDGYKAIEVVDPTFTECLAKGKDCFQHSNPKSSKLHFFFVGKKPFRHRGSTASNLRRMALLGRRSQFLRAQLLMLLQAVMIVSQINFLIELDTDILNE